jgi:hypothetical protein
VIDLYCFVNDIDFGGSDSRYVDDMTLRGYCDVVMLRLFRRDVGEQPLHYGRVSLKSRASYVSRRPSGHDTCAIAVDMLLRQMR